MKKQILNRVVNETILKSHNINQKLFKGAIGTVGLSQKMTKFDIYAILYAQRSKKQRSNEIRVRTGGLQKYQYTGKILKIKKSLKDKLAVSLLIRNLTDLVSFEINLPLFSPLITHFEVKNILSNRNKLPRAHSYYLRKTQPVKSQTEFNYVIL